jgi:acylphosphatase
MGGDASSACTRRRVIFSGHVQGVFFRATAHELSQKFCVAGFVRNQRDGTVELEAEGTGSELDAFLSALSRHFQGYITDEAHTSLPASGQDQGFEIRY